MSTKISVHCSYNEAIKSNTAIRRDIDNVPNHNQLANMIHVAEEVFEPVRKALGNKSIQINSFFRSVELNKAIGGSSTSQHCSGEAMDLDGDNTGVDNKKIFDYIKDGLVFDQLIWEFGNKDKPAWVHVSRKLNGNRRQSLQAYKENGRTRYKEFDLY